MDKILDKKVTSYQKGGNKITYYLVKWKGAVEIEASWEKASTLWQFGKEMKAFEDTLRMRMLASSGGGGLLGALQFADDGMRKRSAWTTSGQSHGSMFSQDTNGSSCLSNEAPKCSLRGTSPAPLLGSV